MTTDHSKHHDLEEWVVGCAGCDAERLADDDACSLEQELWFENNWENRPWAD